MPPFEGPRATLCVTRYPSKTRIAPPSICTGTATSTHFFTPERTLIRLGSIAKTSPTRRSWDRARSNGSSRRCDADSVALIVPLFRPRSRAPSIRPSRPHETSSSHHPEPDRLLVGDADDWCCDEPHGVLAPRKLPPARPATGE